jgi:metallophosphoesterase superfamily enzyme
MEEFRPRLNKNEYKSILNLRSKDNKILIIGDLHAPFIKPGYLKFCKSIYKKYGCNKVIFIGDIIDMHYSSYHEADPDGDSAGAELLKAKKEISYWYKAFPKARVCLGNHDIIPNRKAMSAGVSASWVKDIGEVLDTPNWEYAEEYIIDDVLYVHGTGRKARNRARKDLTSVVQGHYHSESYIEHYVGNNFSIFAMQLGCGIDRKSYAMAYGKHFDKPHINCGVVLENGTLPILEYMPLK